jgi:hypothetical protein
MPFHKNYKNAAGEEIDFELRVYTRPNLRSDDMMVYMGKSYVDNAFDGEKVDKDTTDIYIQYPERWTNLLEQRVLVYRLMRFYPNLKKMTITTHSVYTIQCVHHEVIRIYDDALQYPEENTETSTCRYCPPLVVNTGLQIFGL